MTSSFAGFEMTYVVSGGALNSTHSLLGLKLRHW